MIKIIKILKYKKLIRIKSILKNKIKVRKKL